MAWRAPTACDACRSVLAHSPWCPRRKGYQQPPADRMARAAAVEKTNIRGMAHAERVTRVRSRNDAE